VPDQRGVTVVDRLPGLAVAAAATLAAGYFAQRYGTPLTLMALLIGLALNFLGHDKRLTPGLLFASRTLLRVGIALIGVTITFGQFAGLGLVAFAAVAVLVAVTISAGALLARVLRLGTPFGILAGGAVAICGASAAMAFASLLGEKRLKETDLALVLVGISAASAFAMFAYPMLAHAIGLADRQAGFLLGASVHDVAQALGAGYAFSQPAGEYAAIVKMTRVALLAPALAAVAWFVPPAATSGRGPVLPWFVIAFFGLAALASTGLVPAQASAVARDGATWLLACAVAATGIRSPMAELLRSGPRPLLLIAAISAVAFLAALAAAELVG
jgi:uncharacterized integral membrane protein (TIGR00698 family)